MKNPRPYASPFHFCKYSRVLTNRRASHRHAEISFQPDQLTLLNTQCTSSQSVQLSVSYIRRGNSGAPRGSRQKASFNFVFTVESPALIPINNAFHCTRSCHIYLIHFQRTYTFYVRVPTNGQLSWPKLPLRGSPLYERSD